MTQANPYSPEFVVKDNCLFFCGKGKSGYHEQLLCNFHLQVVREVIVDDGAETVSYVTIKGTHHTGRALQEVEMKSEDALNLNWIQSVWVWTVSWKILPA